MLRTNCLHVCLHIDWSPYCTFNYDCVSFSSSIVNVPYVIILLVSICISSLLVWISINTFKTSKKARNVHTKNSLAYQFTILCFQKTYFVYRCLYIFVNMSYTVYLYNTYIRMFSNSDIIYKLCFVFKCVNVRSCISCTYGIQFVH